MAKPTSQHPMIAVDAHILVYAHRPDSYWHAKARAVVGELTDGSIPWAIALHTLAEFYGIVTDARVYQPPTTPEAAIEQIRSWLASPMLRVLTETEHSIESMLGLAARAKLSGSKIHEARIAAMCRDHHVHLFYTADRSVGRFGDLLVKNPLV